MGHQVGAAPWIRLSPARGIDDAAGAHVTHEITRCRIPNRPAEGTTDDELPTRIHGWQLHFVLPAAGRRLRVMERCARGFEDAERREEKLPGLAANPQHARTWKDDVAIRQWARRQNRPHLVLQRRGARASRALVRARLVAATGRLYWQRGC